MRLQNNLEKLWRPLSDHRPVNILRKLLFAYIIFNFFQLLPVMDILYDPQRSIIKTWPMHGYTLVTLVNLLSVDTLKQYYYLFLGVQVLFAVIGLLGFFPRMSSFVVFFTTINLHNRIYSTISGGDTLFSLMMFYLSFISDGKGLKNENLDQIQNAFDKIFTALCKMQLVVVYLVSALYKLQSPEWINGTALQHIISVDEYSLPFIQSLACSAPFLFKLFTWCALLYQTLFPFMVFVKRVKNYFLVTGVIFHLIIGFGMGLLNFSLVMICCYALFYDFKSKEEIPRAAFF